MFEYINDWQRSSVPMSGSSSGTTLPPWDPEAASYQNLSAGPPRRHTDGISAVRTEAQTRILPAHICLSFAAPQYELETYDLLCL